MQLHGTCMHSTSLPTVNLSRSRWRPMRCHIYRRWVGSSQSKWRHNLQMKNPRPNRRLCILLWLHRIMKLLWDEHNHSMCPYCSSTVSLARLFQPLLLPLPSALATIPVNLLQSPHQSRYPTTWWQSVAMWLVLVQTIQNKEVLSLVCAMKATISSRESLFLATVWRFSSFIIIT